ncbi:alpha/beta hydrolase [Erythrobacter sp. SG61-1L]|uniref:alpha/beta fold hydrolase n=1 Tax=Erythrobacter sp. SG61-1L TaxID=1603897 RepID=UPI0006C9225A|nr:alpha/beta hydrolase [Erythrobacter sp. SG61-1L]
MEFLDTGTARLAYRTDGPKDAPALLCIHGSWDDHHSWNGVAERLPELRTIRYDRRGHSLSSAPPGQGRLSEDVDDALALLDALGIGSAHVIGHSYGANVAIVLAARAPERIGTLFLHEPPVFGLLGGGNEADLALRAEAMATMKRAAELLEAGKTFAGAHLFIEHVAFGPGSWEHLFDAEARATILANAHTWLDQSRDPERLAVDVTALAHFTGPVVMTTGRDSLPAYPATVLHIAAALPAMAVHEVGGGHGAHISHPADIAAVIRASLGE